MRCLLPLRFGRPGVEERDGPPDAVLRGAEFAAQIQEEAFDYLDAPVGRVGAPFSPVPFSPPLEKEYVPNAARIAAEVRRILGKLA